MSVEIETAKVDELSLSKKETPSDEELLNELSTELSRINSLSNDGAIELITELYFPRLAKHAPKILSLYQREAFIKRQNQMEFLDEYNMLTKEEKVELTSFRESAKALGLRESDKESLKAAKNLDSSGRLLDLTRTGLKIRNLKNILELLKETENTAIEREREKENNQQMGLVKNTQKKDTLLNEEIALVNREIDKVLDEML